MEFKNLILLSKNTDDYIMPLPSKYVPVESPIYTYIDYIWTFAFIIAIIFLALLIVNKIKLKKSADKSEEEKKKIYKSIKINLFFLFSIIALIMILIIMLFKGKNLNTMSLIIPIGISMIFLLLLFKDKVKLNNLANLNEEDINKIKKRLEVELWLFISCLMITVVLMGIFVRIVFYAPNISLD